MRNKKTVDEVWGRGTSEAICQWGQPRFYYIDRKDIFALLAEDSTPEIYAHDLRDDSEFLISLSDRNANDIFEMFFNTDSNDLILGSESAIDGYEHLEVEGVTDYEGDMYRFETGVNLAILRAVGDEQNKVGYILPLNSLRDYFDGSSELLAVTKGIKWVDNILVVLLAPNGSISNKELTLSDLPLEAKVQIADCLCSEPEKLTLMYDDKLAYNCYINCHGILVTTNDDEKVVIRQANGIPREDGEDILNSFWDYLNSGGAADVDSCKVFLGGLIDEVLKGEG